MTIAAPTETVPKLAGDNHRASSKREPYAKAWATRLLPVIHHAEPTTLCSVGFNRERVP
jgi:hypothetical protein